MRRHVVLLLAAAGLGCAGGQRLVPAAGVTRSSVDPGAAVVDRGGVTIAAHADAWRGVPDDLDRVMTPIYVRVRNDSDREIAIRYHDFRLESDLGRTLSPLPPIALDRSRPLRTGAAPVLDGSRFRFAPYYRDLFGDDTDYWTGGFAFDPYYYDRYDAWPPALPSSSMVERALPEGVIEAGGWVAGFLYFDAVEVEARAVTLRVHIDLPQREERVATIAILFTPTAS